MAWLSPKWTRTFFRRSEEAYHDDEDELEPLDRKELGVPESPQHLRRDKRWIAVHRLSLYAIVLANGLLFIMSSAMLFSGGPIKKSQCSERDVSSYSPMFDRMNIKREPKRFNFTFWPEDPPSVWQMPPSPATDALWDKFTIPYAIPITGDEVEHLGFDRRTAWPFEKEDAGDDAYFAIIDFVHQAHCLNLFRQTAFPAYYGDLREKFKGNMFPWDDHLLHCQNILMQSILCHGDVEMTIFQKFKGFRGPDANFRLTRQCRNIDDIMQWKEKNQIQPKGKFIDFPSKAIIESDPELILTPKGAHTCQEGLKEIDVEKHCMS